MLDIVEHHFRVILELVEDSPLRRPAALEFLLQTLAPLDVATRGFLDGTRRYAEQRARAEGPRRPRQIPHRPGEFACRKGFSSPITQGAVVEMNNAFIEILGYPPEGMPYRWPHPWLVDKKTAAATT